MRETEAMYINNITNSSSTLTPSQQQAFDEYYDRQIPTVGMLMFFSLIGTPGNITVLVVYTRSRMTTTQFLLSVLAMFDLFTASVGIPLRIFFQMSGLNVKNIHYCKISGALAALCVTPSLYLVLGVSVVRYFYVCRPQSRHFIESKVKSFCVFVFAISMFNSLGLYRLFGESPWADKQMPGFLCNIADKYKDNLFTKIFMALIQIPTLFSVGTIIATNCLIYKRLLKQKEIMSHYKKPVMKKPPVAENSDVKRKRTVVFEISESSHDIPIDSNITIKDDEIVQDFDFISDSKTDIKRLSNNETDIICENECETDTSEKQIDNGHKSTISLGRIKSRENAKAMDKSESTTRTQKVMEKFSGILNENNTRNRRSTCKKDNVKYKKRRSTHKRSSSVMRVKNFNRTTLKLSLVSIVFVITYIPWIAIVIYIQKQGKTPQALQHNLFKYVLLPGINLLYLGCAANPQIYTFVDPTFRSQCKSLFKLFN